MRDRSAGAGEPLEDRRLPAFERQPRKQRRDTVLDAV